MAGTISFGGIGSGMDTEGIVTGLVQASQGPLNTLKNRASATNSAVSTLSSIGSLLSNLKKAVDGLATVRDVGSYKASSSHASVAVSANGTALPSAYKVEVTALAKEQRNYTKTFSSTTAGLNQAGTLGIKVGTADVKNVALDADDTLDEIATKINGAGARVSASVFYDGTSYRLQIRGLDTGAANAITFTEGAGVDLGLNASGSKYQSAQNAAVKIDDIPVSSATNQVIGAIQGVTLALTDVTTSPVTVKVDSDPEGLKSKLKAVVDGYNAVISKIQEVAGNGTVKGSSEVLSGDSGLRSITTRMSSSILTPVTNSGAYKTLASLGLSLGKDGKMTLDATKLDKALAADAASVASVLAGPQDATDGAMDVMSDVIDSFSASTSGVLALRKEALQARAKRFTDSANREQDRLDKYADNLRRQFTQMDTTVAANNAQLSYLTSLYSGR